MRRIGRYEIETEIGRGAMGTVYLAHDPRVRRRVAIKTYRTPEGLTPEQERGFHERFLREAWAAGALNHPAIVTVYDADDDPEQNLPFIAMEYVEGQSLKDFLSARGPLEVEKALDLAGRLADALHHAHEAGITHRDIKPANILVSRQEEAVKIADFGVARMTASELTQSGHALGSPSYMSPEQIRGRPVDGRSDLFSLAIVLYEALCGEKPFSGGDLTSLAYSVVHETPVPISRRRKGLPPGLDRFFEKALAKDPDERFQDGVAFREGLRAAAESELDASRTVVSQAAEATVGEVGATDPSADRSGVPTPVFLERARAGLERWLTTGPGRSRRLRIVSIAVAGACALLVLGAVVASGGATLEIEGHNRLESATLKLFVDDGVVYSRSLAAERKSAKMFGKKMFDYGKEEYEDRIRLPSGKHELVAEVIPEGQSTGYRERLVLDLERGSIHRLKVVTGSSLGSPISLRLD